MYVPRVSYILSASCRACRCMHAANNVSILSEAIESICSDSGFSVPSSEAAGAARCAKILLEWIKNNQHSETYFTFCNNLVKLLMELLPSGSKLSKREEQSFGVNYFKCKCHPKFFKLWEDFFCTCKIEGNVLFYQHASDLVAEAIILSCYKIPHTTASEVHTTASLTQGRLSRGGNCHSNNVLEGHCPLKK